MSLRDLLVLIDDSTACKGRIDAAIALAAAHDAHLTALYFAIRPTRSAVAGVQLPRGILDEQQAANRARGETALAGFVTAAKAQGLAPETRLEDADWSELPWLVERHARYVDVTLIGQHDPKDDESAPSDLLEAVFLGSGRPLLAIPYIGAAEPIGRHVLIAWNASRESIRAVHDAMPILKRADKVSVVTVNAASDPRRFGESPGSDIARHLARHGIDVTSHNLDAGGIGVGDVLLSYASDMSADLIVMGGYGHSPLREMILGGVTRHMLEHMTVPVLMSH